ncbi:hypothetical protein LguiB_034454 [Lonicera macranthoides]
MGKQGPCYHCGVTNTPLWRNGPPEKPILCNACGSRWRTKGTLANYTPLHARAEPDEFEDYRVSRVKSISIKNKEAKVLKRKQNYDNAVAGVVTPDYNYSFHKVLDEDTSNKSSSGSAISNSESCVQLSNADASDLTDPAQSVVWDTMVPSRKRTCVSRQKPSSIEKLTKDLYNILHEQQLNFSGLSEEDLLFESDMPMVSVEIGHGSMLIRHPSSIAREEESEASSLSFDNKQLPSNEAYSRLTTTLSENISYKGVDFQRPWIEKTKKLTGLGNEQEQMERDKFQHEKLQTLGNHKSPLCNIDPKDVLNFEELVNHMTSDEQQQLLKYLRSIDNERLPDSLKSIFDSPQFKEKLSSFKKLLAEGVFDLSLGVKSEGFRTLKRLMLGNLTKSEWIEQYNLLKELKCKNSVGGSVVAQGLNAIPTCHSVNVKRSRDGQYQNFPGTKAATIKSPKGLVMKASYEQRELIDKDNDGTYFSPKSLFTLPPDSSSLMLESFCYENQSSDNDLLLLDVPSNSSFPQAELLFLPTSQASTSSSSIYQNVDRP